MLPDNIHAVVVLVKVIRSSSYSEYFTYVLISSCYKPYEVYIISIPILPIKKQSIEVNCQDCTTINCRNWNLNMDILSPETVFNLRGWQTFCKVNIILKIL